MEPMLTEERVRQIIREEFERLMDTPFNAVEEPSLDTPNAILSQAAETELGS